MENFWGLMEDMLCCIIILGLYFFWRNRQPIAQIVRRCIAYNPNETNRDSPPPPYIPVSCHEPTPFIDVSLRDSNATPTEGLISPISPTERHVVDQEGAIPLRPPSASRRSMVTFGRNHNMSTLFRSRSNSRENEGTHREVIIPQVMMGLRVSPLAVASELNAICSRDDTAMGAESDSDTQSCPGLTEPESIVSSPNRSNNSSDDESESIRREMIENVVEQNIRQLCFECPQPKP